MLSQHTQTNHGRRLLALEPALETTTRPTLGFNQIKHRIGCVLAAMLVFGLPACAWAQSNAQTNTAHVAPTDATNNEQTPDIVWQEDSLRLIQRGGVYGRIVRLSETHLLAVCSVRRQIVCIHSQDNGQTWGESQTLTDYAFGSATNAEAIVLKSGTILLGMNLRPNDGQHPFAIATMRSLDQGQTWSPMQVIYEAGPTGDRGCWEPAFCQLPNGQVHVYFANEFPFADSHEQEITWLRSTNDGQSWSPARQVAFTPHGRDGMPVPVLTQDGRFLLLAIEDNGHGHPLQPAIIRTSPRRPWGQGSVGTDSPSRMRPIDLPKSAYGGAPYLCQLPAAPDATPTEQRQGGPLVLVFQHEPSPPAGRPAHVNATPAAALGDAQRLQFGELTHPLAFVGKPRGLWNSVFAKDHETVTLVTETTIDGVQGLYALDGKVMD